MIATEGAWDYVIVGAGSAGCVLAERLSRDPRCRVLLLEAGGANDRLLIDMPKGIAKVTNDPRHAWHFPVAQARLAGEPSSEVWIRGRGLGGSSAINGMIWMRGQADDYEAWRRHGCVGWGAAEMDEAFNAIEDHELGAGPHRGEGGPVHISLPDDRYPLAEALIAACEGNGLRRVEDVNAPGADRVGYCPYNIRRGVRESADRTFLKPARRRPNLRVETGVVADRIRFEGRRAVAVDVVTGAGMKSYAIAGEVILSSGTIGSPAILQRSGIGDGRALAALGIEVVADRSAVGRHVRDHVGLATQFRLRGDRGRNHLFRSHHLARNVIRYLLRRDGPMAGGPYEIVAFARANPKAQQPDLELLAGAFSLVREAARTKSASYGAIERQPGFSIYAQLLQPISEGHIRIASPTAAAPPVIEPNWLVEAEDQVTAVASMRLVRRIVRHPAIAPFIESETRPGATAGDDDAELLASFRRLMNPGTHAVGSCRMGGSDRDDVLDPALRVRGVDGVRVVDCSAMPLPVSGNTNAPAMAFAWLAGNMIASRQN